MYIYKIMFTIFFSKNFALDVKTLPLIMCVKIEKH